MTESKIPMTYQQAKFKMFLNLLGGVEDTNYLYIEDTNDNTLTLVMYLGNRTSIKVPKKIDGKTVTKIACTCFNYNTNITSVKIPEGVEVIE